MSFSKRMFNLLLFTGFFLMLWGCIEYTITTQVMPDGRILRTISVRGDSASVLRGSFRVPTDSTWTIISRYEKNEKDSSDDKIYVYEAMKEFANATKLNAYFYIDSTPGDHIITRVNLTKKSKWFYTYYTYSETYSRLFPFKSVPISRYLTDSELQIYNAGDDEVYYSPERDSLLIVTDSVPVTPMNAKDSLRSRQLHDTLEYKFEVWQKINIFNDFYAEVRKALEKMGKQDDTVKAGDRFYHWLDSTNVFEQVMQNSDAFTNAASVFFRVDSTQLRAANAEGFESFNGKFKISALTLESFVNQVLMPGMILSANTPDIKGNLVIWRYKINNFYAADYSMVVRSRAVNKHAVFGVAFLLIIIVALWLARLFRKQKTPV